MYKRYFSDSDERKLKEKAVIAVREVSTNVYYVEKNRTDVIKSGYISSEQLIVVLNMKLKVAVLGNSGVYSNFDMEEQDF